MVQETRYVNKTRIVKKLDQELLIGLRKKTHSFFEAGRTQFNIQLLKWRELFEETSEDHFEMQSRIEKLEALANV